MKKMMTYRVNEIFYSLQGEGMWTGTPAVFVRLSGCNLKCPLCDTDHSAYVTMTVDEIMSAVNENVAPIVVLTGGEPSLQPLGPLVEAIKKTRRRVHVETNGTNDLPMSVDWITCSPKKGGEVKVSRIDELKIVFQGEDVEWVTERFGDVPNLFLQPCSGLNVAETVDYVLSHPHWRLSLQTHKLLDIR